MIDHTLPLFTAIAEAAAPIKVVLFFVVWGMLWLPIAIPLAITLQWRPPRPVTPQQKLPLVLSLYLLAPLILGGFAWLEQVPFSVYGLTWSPAILLSFTKGVGIGILGLGILLGSQISLGWLTLRSENWPQLLPSTLFIGLIGVAIGGVEELVFRGFLLNQLIHLPLDYSNPVAIELFSAAGISSVIFALSHLVWEGADNIPQLPGLWLMGIVLCVARWVDHGNLGLAWGLHMGWIWVIASLDTAQLLHYPGHAPQWLTGVAGKPLAGVMGVFFLLGTGFVLMLSSLS
jgi:uncharacterized protein